MPPPISDQPLIGYAMARLREGQWTERDIEREMYYIATERGWPASRIGPAIRQAKINWKATQRATGKRAKLPVGQAFPTVGELGGTVGVRVQLEIVIHRRSGIDEIAWRQISLNVSPAMLPSEIIEAAIGIWNIGSIHAINVQSEPSEAISGEILGLFSGRRDGGIDVTARDI